MDSIFQKRGAGYIAAALGIAAVTAICAPFHDQLNHTTVALALLLVVLFVATVWGSWPALIASVLGMRRGRNAGCPTPPAQIPASGTTAQGSCLGFMT